MRRTSILFFALILSIPAVLQAQGMMNQSMQHPMMTDTVRVSGTATLFARPDQVSFTVGVQTTGQTVDQAVRENNQKLANVIAALKKAGATPDEIRTSGFSIQPRQDYREGQPPRILGYQVSNQVSVTKKDVTAAGTLLQAAVEAGANAASGISFEVSNPESVEQEGLKRAFDRAREKASVLAAQAGRTLGRAVTITEGTETQPPMPMVHTMRAEASVGNVPVESGTQQMDFTVTVTFQMQ